MPKHQLKTSIIYCGDNLQMLKEIPDESVDLIYIDPPFNSNRNYEAFWGDIQEKRAFEDRFGDAQHYIEWMRPRVDISTKSGQEVPSPSFFTRYRAP